MQTSLLMKPAVSQGPLSISLMTLVHCNQHTVQLTVKPTKHLQTKAFTNISFRLSFDNRISEDMLRFTEDLPAHLNPIHNTF